MPPEVPPFGGFRGSGYAGVPSPTRWGPARSAPGPYYPSREDAEVEVEVEVEAEVEAEAEVEVEVAAYAPLGASSAEEG